MWKIIVAFVVGHWRYWAEKAAFLLGEALSQPAPEPDTRVMAVWPGPDSVPFYEGSSPAETAALNAAKPGDVVPVADIGKVKLRFLPSDGPYFLDDNGGLWQILGEGAGAMEIVRGQVQEEAPHGGPDAGSSDPRSSPEGPR